MNKTEKLSWNIGTKVRIKNNLEPEKIYGGTEFEEEMLPYCGKDAIIREFSLEEDCTPAYLLDIDDMFWSWNEEMLEKIPSETPILDYMLEIQEQSKLCGEFLEWLQRKYAMFRKDVPREEPFFRGNGDYINIEETLAEFFNVDLEEAEKEKEKLLKTMR